MNVATKSLLERIEALPYAAIEESAALPIALVPSRVLGRRAIKLAIQHLGTFYDALYIALAEREDLKVITADDRMANAFARIQLPLPAYRG